jgi:serine/threonine protein phosphatase PrpC
MLRSLSSKDFQSAPMEEDASVHSTTAGSIGDVPCPLPTGVPVPSKSSPLFKRTLGSFSGLRRALPKALSLRSSTSLSSFRSANTSASSLSSATSNDSGGRGELHGESGPHRQCTSDLRPSKGGLREAFYDGSAVQYGVSQCIGKKDQDRFDVRLGGDQAMGSDCHYFAVFDGHGTSALAADICMERLWDEVAGFQTRSRSVSRAQASSPPSTGSSSISSSLGSGLQSPQMPPQARGDSLGGLLGGVVGGAAAASGSGLGLGPGSASRSSSASGGPRRLPEHTPPSAEFMSPPEDQDGAFASRSLSSYMNDEEGASASSRHASMGGAGLGMPDNDAVAQGFMRVDELVLAQRHVAPRAGTCGVTLFVNQDDAVNSMDTMSDDAVVEGKVAWVGDCRCFMVSNAGIVMPLTLDHRPDVNPAEVRRIAQADHTPRAGLLESSLWQRECAKAQDEGQMHRLRAHSFVEQRFLNGQPVGPRCIFSHSGGVSLQVTRSIGDAYAARSVTSEPDIVSFSIPRGEHTRFVLGSDGIFEVLTEMDCANFISRISSAGKAASKLASHVKQKRLYGGFSADDITVIVLDINPEARSKKRHSPKSGAAPFWAVQQPPPPQQQQQQQQLVQQQQFQPVPIQVMAMQFHQAPHGLTRSYSDPPTPAEAFGGSQPK